MGRKAINSLLYYGKKKENTYKLLFEKTKLIEKSVILT